MKAAIIGSGVAGLASSVRLAVQGHEVHVFESNSYPGGKLHEFKQKGFRFDAGPSVSTMPYLVDELFELAEKNPRDHFNYKKKEIVCKYFYPDKTCITGYYDNDKFSGEVEEKLGVKKNVLLSYLKHCKENHELAGDIFLKEPIHELKTFTTAPALKAIINLPKLDIFNTMNSVNEKMLAHPKLVQLFNRYATFNGSSPYLAPGILNTIAHLEYGIGSYFIEGGFYSMTRSIYELALELGVKFHFDSKVDKIFTEDGIVKGIRTKNKIHFFDIVISNMDIVPTYKYLLSDQFTPERIIKQERSTSMLVFYWGVKGNFPQLDLHNAFFTSNYQEEFDHLFNKKTVYDDPTIYINITSKEQDSDAPKGYENWFTMINVPANNGQDWDEIITRTKRNVIKKLNNILGIELESLIEFEDLLEPRIIEQRTSSYTGSIYGASSNNKFSAFMRQSNKSNQVKGLYFAGGSVHPGGGTPLCLLSAKITTDRIKKDLE